MTVFTWAAGTSGDWGTQADWVSNAVPGSLDSATFTGSQTYVVTISTGEQISALVMNAANATLQLYYGSTLTDTGVLNINKGTLVLGGNDAVADATIKVGAGGTVDLTSQAVLSNDTYDGTIDISGTYQGLTIAGNLTMAGSTGTGDGTINLSGDLSTLFFQGGSQTLDGATVDIGSGGYYSSIEMEYYYTPQYLTFTSKTVIAETGSGTTGQITTNNSYNTITNNGIIESVTAGSTLNINGGGELINTGTINVGNYGTMVISLGSFVNTGKIIENSGVLTIDADETIAQLGTIVRTGGTLTLGGTIDNTGNTLDVGTGPLGTFDLNGTIENGSIHDLGDGLDLVGGATFSGVTYDGALAMVDYSSLTIQNGIVLTGLSGTGAGTLDGSGADDIITFSGSAAQTLDNATYLVGNTRYFDSVNINGTLTFGSHLQFQHVTGYVSVSVQGLLTNDGTITAAQSGGSIGVSGSTFVNAGLISVSNGDTVTLTTSSFTNTGTITVTTGGVLTLGSSGGTVVNTGKVSENDGTVIFGGSSVTVAQLLAIKRTGGTLTVGGTLDLGKATLNVGTGSALGTLALSGVIQNGTIHDAGGAMVFEGSVYAPSVLSNIKYLGTLDLSPASSYLQVTNGFSLTGLSGTGTSYINLTGASSELTVVGSNTLDNITLDIGGTEPVGSEINPTSTLAVAPINSSTPVSLTLGVNAMTFQTGTDADFFANYYAGDVIANRGIIKAGVTGGSFYVSGAMLTNSGLISIFNGDTFNIQTSAFVNTGTVAVTTGGELILNGSWSSTGVISESAGTVLLEGFLSQAQLGEIKRTGGTLTVAGSLTLTTATLNVGTGSALGDFAVTGSVSGGTIHDGGGGLVFGSAGVGASVGNLTYEGTLEIGAVYNGTNQVAGTLIDTGSLDLTGSSGHGAGALVMNGGTLGSLLLFDSTTLDNATITLAGASDTMSLYDNGTTQVTFGANLTITQAGKLAEIESYNYLGYYYYTGDSFTNNGTINASYHHGTFDMYGETIVNNGVINISNGDYVVIDPTDFTNAGTISITNGGVGEIGYGTFTDTGKITETNSTLLLYGSLTTASLAAVTRSGGMVEIGGSLELAGSILNVGSASVIGSLALTGIIADGTIHDAGSGMQFYGAYLGQTYYGSSGTLDSITYQGVLDMRTSYSSLDVADGLTLTGVAGTGVGVVALTGAGSLLTFDDTQTFDNATITIGNTALQSALDFADTSADGETLTLGAHLLINTRSGMSQIQSTRALGDTILNDGTIQDAAVGAKLTVFGGTFDNVGIVNVANSAAMFLEPDTLVNGIGGTIQVGGGGDLTLGSASGGGLYKILAGGTLDFSDTAGASVVSTFAAATGTLILEAPTAYIGKIAGFAIGDTIDLSGVPLAGTSASITGTTLTVKQSGGPTLTLALTSAPTGKVGVSTDGRGGTDITLSAAAVAKMAFIPGADGTGIYSGTAAAISGHTFQGFVFGDEIDVTDLSFAGALLKIANGAANSTFTLTGGGETAHFTLAGGFTGADFYTRSDGHGGTALLYSPHT